MTVLAPMRRKHGPGHIVTCLAALIVLAAAAFFANAAPAAAAPVINRSSVSPAAGSAVTVPRPSVRVSYADFIPQGTRRWVTIQIALNGGAAATRFAGPVERDIWGGAAE